MTKKRRVKYLVLIAISLFIFCGCAKKEVEQKVEKPTVPEKDVYTIAVAAPQFGPYEALGLSIIHGAELAVSQKNKDGGIDGKQIELLKVDDGGLPGEGTWRAKTLVAQMVLGVIGHLNSDISIPASEVYSKAKIPQISPGSTSPFFTDREKVKGYVFRTIGRDDHQGKVSAEYVKEKNYKKVAVIYNNRTYGSSLSTEFVKELSSKTEGQEVRPELVYYKPYKVGADDFTEEIENMEKVSPECIFFVGEYGEASKFLTQLRARGIKSTFLGSDGVFDEEFIVSDANAVEGALVISSLPVKANKFRDAYKEKFGKEIGGFSATAYDATNILISAIEKVKGKDSEKIAQEIQKTTDYEGVTGKITFDEKGDLKDPRFVFYQVMNGMFTLPVD